MKKGRKLFIPIITHINEGKGHVYGYQKDVYKSLDKNLYEYLPIVFFDKKIGFLDNIKNKIVLKNYFIDLNIDKIFHFNLLIIIFKTIKDTLKLSKQLSKLNLPKERKLIFFLESFNNIQFYIFLKFYRKLKIEKKRIIILLRGSPFSGSGLMRLYYFSFYLVLKYNQIFLKNYILATDSETLKVHLEKIYNKEVSLINIPTNMVKNNNKIKKKNIISLPGAAREQKGINSFINTIIFFKNDYSYLISGELKKRLKKYKTVNYFNNNLSKSDYTNIFKLSKIVLLDYDEKIYKYATSGIFFDCISNNCIMLVSDNTWMSSILKKYGLNQLIIKNQFDIINFINGYFQFDFFKKEIDSKFNNFRNKVLNDYSFKKSFNIVLKRCIY